MSEIEQVKSIDDITADWIVAKREADGLGPEEFWGPIRVKRGSAHRYEKGCLIPEHVRMLIYLHHVIGIPLNAEHQDLSAAGSIINSMVDAIAFLRNANRDTVAARKKIEFGINNLTALTEIEHGSARS